MGFIRKSPYFGAADAVSPSCGAYTSAQKTKFVTNAAADCGAVIVGYQGNPHDRCVVTVYGYYAAGKCVS
jgi:hypothetical protein